MIHIGQGRGGAWILRDIPSLISKIEVDIFLKVNSQLSHEKSI